MSGAEWALLDNHQVTKKSSNLPLFGLLTLEHILCTKSALEITPHTPRSHPADHTVSLCGSIPAERECDLPGSLEKGVEEHACSAALLCHSEAGFDISDTSRSWGYRSPRSRGWALLDQDRTAVVVPPVLACRCVSRAPVVRVAEASRPGVEPITLLPGSALQHLGQLRSHPPLLLGENALHHLGQLHSQTGESAERTCHSPICQLGKENPGTPEHARGQKVEEQRRQDRNFWNLLDYRAPCTGHAHWRQAVSRAAALSLVLLFDNFHLQPAKMKSCPRERSSREPVHRENVVSGPLSQGSARREAVLPRPAALTLTLPQLGPGPCTRPCLGLGLRGPAPAQPSVGPAGDRRPGCRRRKCVSLGH
ncbi:uncharacterized protein LOC104865352 [Fukomys damarensis]|uniref:uncharacterized protein LOC104865352 n=1 Tax=Fukomys damarensis TaxID=885580 RepID=UPI00053F2AB0|nr:uncharacterized protein LOC104865352 [Fukomys damarensis]